MCLSPLFFENKTQTKRVTTINQLDLYILLVHICFCCSEKHFMLHAFKLEMCGLSFTMPHLLKDKLIQANHPLEKDWQEGRGQERSKYLLTLISNISLFLMSTI